MFCFLANTYKDEVLGIITENLLKMAKNLGIIIVIILIILAGFFLYFQISKMSSGAKNNGEENNVVNDGISIEIKDFLFNPMEIRIKVGDSVTWTNKDSMKHTVTSDSGNELNSATLSQGDTYSHTFNKVGTFDYHCTIHLSMKAKIIVE